MNVQKRDILAAFLSYLFLQFTLFNNTYDSSKDDINVHFQFSFYTEYTSFPPPHIQSSTLELDTKTDRLNRKTARPLILLEHDIMIVPFLISSSASTTPISESKKIENNDDDEEDDGKYEKLIQEKDINPSHVQLRIVDISQWNTMNHLDPMTMPFHAKFIAYLQSPPSTNSANIGIPVKLVASPIYSQTGAFSAQKFHSKTSKEYRKILSVWSHGCIALYEIPPPLQPESSKIDSDSKERSITFIWQDDVTLTSLLHNEDDDSKVGSMIIQGVDAVFHTLEDKSNVVLLHVKIESKTSNTDEKGEETELQTEFKTYDILLSINAETGSLKWIHTNHFPTSQKQISPPHSDSSNIEISYIPSKSTVDCLQRYRSTIMRKQKDNQSHPSVFPHFFWDGKEDSTLHLGYFDRRHHHGHDSTKGTSKTQKSKTQKVFTHPLHHHHHHHYHHQQHAHNPPPKSHKNDSLKANIIISHGKDGIQVYSLKNGHPVCHTSLLGSGNSYADINQDGILDHVHVPTIRSEGEEPHLPASLYKLWEQSGLDPNQNRSDDNFDHCRIVGYSGVPPVEELFQSSSLCEWNRRRNSYNNGPEYSGTSVSTSPPLFMPNRENGNLDMFLAFHHGKVTKYEFPSQHESDLLQYEKRNDIWKWDVIHKNTPKWNPTPEGQGASLITSIPSSFGKAILVSGEDGMSAFSQKSGFMHSSVIFPQKSMVWRPVLMHVGDYSRHLNEENNQKDLVFVFSVDGLWGYTVTVGRTKDAWTFFAVAFVSVLGLLVLMKVYKGKADKRCMEWNF